MKLTFTEQVAAGSLEDLEFDLFVGASGFEKRATHALKFLNLGNVERKIALGFRDRINEIRIENDRIFTRAGCDLVEMDGDVGSDISAKIYQLIEESPREELRIFVDYSSMTRLWYAAVISAIRSISNKKRVDCLFSYSPSVFEPPPPTAPNQSVSPIPGFSGLDVIDLPSALVVGLGYERDRAIGLLEYVDPAVCCAFITDPPMEPAYLEFLKINNGSFLRLIRKENQYVHPLEDLQRTSNLLLSLVWGLSEQHRIILAPLGVKPFSLICLLLAVRYPEVDVWRVTSGTKGGTLIREPLGPILVLRAVFESDSSGQGD